MAGFTSMALLGAGLLGGSLIGRATRKKNDPAQQPTLAPPPVAPVAPPAPPIVDPGQQQAAAGQAAIKVRKRAAVGSMLTNPKAPKSSTMPVGVRYAKPTLLGS